MLAKIKKELRSYINPEKAAFYPHFFKTEKGGYGEGDWFLGVTVPNQRKVAKKYALEVSEKNLLSLLSSKYHEERLLALFMLIIQFQKGDEKECKRVFTLYKKNLKYVNNWDLVDASAYKIVGYYLQNKDRKQLYTWSKSKDLWKRRISMVSTFAYIREGDLDDAFQIAEVLIYDKEDLMHKAVGWMLREAGKRDVKRLYHFLDKYASTMPRTALRYSIEKLSSSKKKYYMKK